MDAQLMKMPIELDHIFVCTSPGGEEARALAEFGLSKGTPNTHSGQGTACRRFFFRNAHLELLWVTDPGELPNIAKSQYLCLKLQCHQFLLALIVLLNEQ